ncbi:hypothetical protein MKW92_039143 [Papaver armeniacum]|nr:hypothetical protein MKW92_039143 [Papaver armeniacum]
MAQIQKLEVVHEVKCCADKLYRMCTRDASQLSKYLPNLIKSVEVIGEGETLLGMGFVWNFVAEGGSVMTGRSVITAVDNKNRSATFTILEGDIMKDFKSFNFSLDITPRSGSTNGTSLVKWSVEYEKTSDVAADPVGLLKACELVTTGMNSHLLKQA